MTGRLQSWMVALLLLGTMAVALAEELTLTTYYPSPRGMYDELRTAGNVAIGTLNPPTPGARLEIVGGGATSATSALQIRNADGTALLGVENGGNVGIGTMNPASTSKLDVIGTISATTMSATNMSATTMSVGGSPLGVWSVSGPDIFRSSGKVSIGLSAAEVPGNTAKLRIVSSDMNDGDANTNGDYSMFADYQGKLLFSVKNNGNTSLSPDRGKVVIGAWSQNTNTAKLRVISNEMGNGPFDYSIFADYKGAVLFNVGNNGNVGIGTMNPEARLSFSDAIEMNKIYFINRVNDKYGLGVRLDGTGGGQLVLYAGANPDNKVNSISFGKFDGITYEEGMRLTPNTWWGTGLRLDAGGTAGGRQWLLASTGGSAEQGQGKFVIQDQNTFTDRFIIHPPGSWASAEIRGSDANTVLGLGNCGSGSGGYAAYFPSIDLAAFGLCGKGGLQIRGVGGGNWRAGIKTADPQFDLHVNGSFGAWSITTTGGAKNFAIDHPTKPGKKLVHSSIEGPEIAVFYRGEGQVNDGETAVHLPDYFEALTNKEGRTVLLTPKFESADQPISALAASSVENGKFLVRSIDNRNPNQRFYWEVKAVRVVGVGPLEVEPNAQ